MSRLSPRQRAIIDYMRMKGGRGSAHPEHWHSVPQPNAPVSYEQMRDSLNRMAARDIVEARPGGYFHLTGLGWRA